MPGKIAATTVQKTKSLFLEVKIYQILKSKVLKGIIFELNVLDPNFESIISILNENDFVEEKRYIVPNEPNLYNIIFIKY